MSVLAYLLMSGCVLVLVVAFLVGGAAGYLARRDGASYPAAVTRAATAFGATLGVVAAVVGALAAVVAVLR
ncbi:hypothetical protein ACWCPI_17705 [Streptomyces sp. NPDC001920]